MAAKTAIRPTNLYIYALYTSAVFTNTAGNRDLIPGRVIPKTQKWYLMPSCPTLSIVR